MSQFLRLAGGQTGLHASVVFFHGLGGDVYDTWSRQGSLDSLWPRWLAEDIPGLAVFSARYEAPVSRWRGTAMHLADRAANLLERLLVEPDLQNGPLILIGHSLGGLIIKQLLRVAESEAKSRNEVRKLLSRVEKIAFLATPHMGSGLAAWGDRLRILIRPSAATSSLVRNDPNLGDLNRWYRNWANSSNITQLNLVETKPTNFFGVVVSADSSDPGIMGSSPIPIDADHVGICKLKDKSSEVYLHILAFIQRSTRPASVLESMRADGPARYLAANTPSGQTGTITNNLTINIYGSEPEWLPELLRTVAKPPQDKKQ